MNRKLKALGLVLFAAFVLSAVAAASASAVTHDFEVSETGTLTVSALGPHIIKAETASEDQTSCTGLSATGTLQGKKSELTTTPQYTNCKAKKGGTEVTAFTETNNCDYLFTGTTTSGNPTGGEHATLHIKPTSGTECHIETKVTALKLKCLSIPNQEIKDAVRYEAGANEDIVIKATAHGLKMTTTNSAGCPTPEGKTIVHENGTYAGEVTVKAHNAAEKNVPIKLAQTP